MQSLDSAPNFDDRPFIPLDAVLTFLKPLGLVPDAKRRPLYSLMELFEALPKGKRVNRQKIKDKIVSLDHFLACYQQDQSLNPTLGGFISRTSLKDKELLSDDLFYDNIILNLFSYAFGLRLELYHIDGGRLSVEYFGFKEKPVRMILVASESYIMLHKTTNECDTTNYKGIAKSISTASKLNRFKSYRTMTTKFTEKDATNTKSTKDAPAKATNGINGDSITERHQIPFNITPEAEALSVVDDSDQSTFNCERIKQQQAHFPFQGPSPMVQTPQFGNNSGFSPTGSELPLLQHLSELYLITAKQNSLKLSSSALSGKKTVGRLKFYNDTKEYGFIIMNDESEIFVHKADLIKQNIDTRYLAYYKNHYEIFMEFSIQEYQGKTKKHRKAVDIQIYDAQAIC